MNDVLIIGSGPSGIFSIFSCGLLNLKTDIISNDNQLGGQLNFYLDKFLYDIPGFFKIKSYDLIENLKKQIQNFHYNFINNTTVVDIQKENNYFKVICLNNEIYYSKTIILAVGIGISFPIKISYEFDYILYNLDNINQFYNKKIAILGAGNTACEYAIELNKIAKHIILIHRGNIKAFPKLFETFEKLNNKTIYENYLINNIYEKKIIIENKNNLEKKEIEIDYIIPCYGMQNNNLLKNLNIRMKNNKFEVNLATMQTSLEGLYAIGDCCCYENKQNLILTGFSESFQAANAIFSYIYPEKMKSYQHNSEKDFFKKY